MRISALILVSAASIAGAQDTIRTKWSLSLGTATTLFASRSGGTICGTNCDGWGGTTQSQFVTGAEKGRFGAGAGISRRIRATALNWRLDAQYTLGTSAARGAYHPWIFGPGGTVDTSMSLWVQPARRDETVSLTAGLQWEALPDRRFSPYVTTAFGLAFNRLSWNSDSISQRIDSRHYSWRPMAQTGVGIRYRLNKRELFVETRSFKFPGEVPLGTVFNTLSFGFRR